MTERNWTVRETCLFVLASVSIAENLDQELGHALMQYAAGNDDVLPAIHDRLNVLGEFEHADRVLRAIENPEDPGP